VFWCLRCWLLSSSRLWLCLLCLSEKLLRLKHVQNNAENKSVGAQNSGVAPWRAATLCHAWRRVRKSGDNVALATPCG